MDRTLTAPRPAPPVPTSAPPTARRSGHAMPTPSPGPSASGADRRPGPERSALPYRRVVYGVLVGALTMFAVATLDAFAGATVPVLGQIAALPGPAGTPTVVEVPPPPSQPGTCLSWSRPDAADAAVVDCVKEHLFEQAGSVRLVDQPTLPDDQQWRQLVKERCDPIVATYLKGRLDPDGRYRIGALKPSATKWSEGDRDLRCGLQRSAQSGALYPTSGKVADTDQSDVQGAGTCLAIDGRGVGDPTACTRAHAVETVGVVDLAQKFAGGFPAVGDQDAYLQPLCATIASDYAGGDPVIRGKNLTVYWDNVTADSWKAGSRKVNCNLAALLPDRSGFAPVTGSVKGTVTVGDHPAPPTTDGATPGAPVPTSPANPADGPTTAPSTSAPAPPVEVPDGSEPPSATSTTAPAAPTLPPELKPSSVDAPD